MNDEKPDSPGASLDLAWQIWHNLPIVHIERVDGNEYIFANPSANPGACEPGRKAGWKILPECELKGLSAE
jgi:hypothetical protein